jgi:hypothetical protein
LKEAGETFANKLDHYYGKNEFVRKRTAEDKRNAKAIYKFEMAPNTIKRKWQRVDEIIKLRLLEILFLKNKHRNRY